MGWITKNIKKDIADYLFNIRLDCLPDRIGVYQRDIRPDLTIDFEMLEEQLQETQEMLAFWDQLLAEQKAKTAALLRKKEATRGYLVKSMLEEAKDAGVKLRSDDLKHLLCVDKNLIKLEIQIINETRKEDKVRSAVRAIQMKSEHLRSLSGFKREEKRQVR
jgi:hypothetical protein